MSDDAISKFIKLPLNKKYLYFQKNGIPTEILDKIKKSKPKQIISDNYPYDKKMSRKIYETEKHQLQIEFAKLQRWVVNENKKIVIVFEGRDAAGKGGTIKRFMEHTNPRKARVVALNKPSATEMGQWYFQRYIERLPTKGEITFFDRSWYNRAGVETVMKFCTRIEFQQFINQVPSFERMLIESNIKLVKFWFSISREEQLRRFIARTIDPLKQWKLSNMDILSLPLWQKYTEAKEAMFYFTDNIESPWTVIRSDDKKRARLNAMRHVLLQFDYPNKNKKILKLDKKVIGSAKNIYEPDEAIERKIRKKKKQ